MNNIIKYNQFESSFATELPNSFGKKTYRLALNGGGHEVKIAACNRFCSIVSLVDKILASLFSYIGPFKSGDVYKRKWVEVLYETPNKLVQKKLLNINSLCTRTLLKREEILSKTPEELSGILAQPDNIIRKKKKLNDYFPHAFLINLDQRPDRIEKLQEHLSNIGERNFNYTRISAVLGKNLDPKLIEKMSLGADSAMSKKDDRPGRVGVFLSHLNALKKAKQDNLPSVLILEDDIRFKPEYFACNYVEKALNELPANWGICFLGYYEAYKKNLKKYSERLVQPGLPYDMHAWLINASMYDEVIDLFEKEFNREDGKKMRPCDVVMAEDVVKTNRVFALATNAIIQDEGQSSIMDKIVFGNYIVEVSRLKEKFPSTHIYTKYDANGLPVVRPLVAGALYQTMYHIDEVFRRHGIEYWVTGKTLLGVERQGGLNPSDTNLNICIAPGMEEKLSFGVMADLRILGLEIQNQSTGALIMPLKQFPHSLTERIKQWANVFFSIFRRNNPNSLKFKTPSAQIYFTKKEEIFHEGNKEEAIVFSMPEARKSWDPSKGGYIRLCELGDAKRRNSFGPLQVNSLVDGVSYCKRIYGSSCMVETYDENDKEKRPVKMIDYRLPAFKQWDGITQVNFK